MVWASGSGGTLLRTLNAGETWTKLTPPAGGEKLDFRDIDAFSDRVAYALSIGNGETSRIYKTTDGGANWDLQFANTDPKVFLDAMAFWDAERGIAFSDSVEDQFVILRTVNGGKSWDRVPQAGLPAALPGEGAFAASGGWRGHVDAVEDSDRVSLGCPVGDRIRRTHRARHPRQLAQPRQTVSVPSPDIAPSGSIALASRLSQRGHAFGR